MTANTAALLVFIAICIAVCLSVAVGSVMYTPMDYRLQLHYRVENRLLTIFIGRCTGRFAVVHRFQLFLYNAERRHRRMTKLKIP